MFHNMQPYYILVKKFCNLDDASCEQDTVSRLEKYKNEVKLFCLFLKKKFPKESLRAGFEPARGDPIGFRVQRLNHSAIAAAISTWLDKPFKNLSNVFILSNIDIK